ncbi:MAG: efflux RND transporter periplasmic adaptor subunit [Candidatus Sungbacteria bacterium]|uniref:Efflux RND transporter periplasmic adaptor subunit n=1 Tax=Candidatus Sungiibacteriota bacterium TaxID=2750080 RepID=A0A932YYQ4_9BACT|nr:efflux RND transporter periplasmic adaptor subunit [Candidatus Sungbacteria bacterium]
MTAQLLTRLSAPLRRPIIFAPLLLAAAGILIYLFFFRGSEAESGFVAVRRGTIIQEVTVTGKTKAASSVNLGFEKSGRVASVHVEVGSRVAAGTILATLDQSALAADLAEAEAGVNVRQAKLKNAELALEDARQGMRDTLQDSYTKADDAVRNRVDQFFSSPRSANPQLIFTTESTLESFLESERFFIEAMLVSWQSALSELTPAGDLGEAASAGKANLTRLNAFLNQAALALNNLRPSTTLTQATIDTWRSDVSTARTNVNTATANLAAADETLRRAPGDIAAEQAELAAADAKINSIRAQFEKTLLRAPFDGVVVKQDAKVGEIASADSPLVTINSEGALEIEANIPEADIASVTTGDLASVTLDAYGSDVVFSTRVSRIDPAETIVEGVATYTATFLFLSSPKPIRPGMTADIDIQTDQRENVLILPQRAVITKNGEKFVRVREGDGTREVRVMTGLRGSDGSIEITAGLREGEIVASSPQS